MNSNLARSDRSDEVKRLLDDLRAVHDPAAEECSRARIGAVYQGREADCLPILFGVYDANVSVDLHEQFYSPQVMLIAHLKRIVEAALIPHNGQPCIRANLGVVLVPSVFGLEPEVPMETMPRFRTHLTKEEIAAYELPADISRCDLIARAIDYSHYFRETLGDLVHVYMPDTQGVFDIAHLVLGDQLFYDLYDNPEFVHDLLELCLQAYLRVTLTLKPIIGEPLTSGYHGHAMGCGICMSKGGARVSEDTPTLLMPDHIDEFVTPYVQRALRPFGGGFVHYCGRNDHLFQSLLSIPEVRGIHLGNPEKHDPVSHMRMLLAHDKFYLGSWPREPSEGLCDYLRRILDLTDGQRKGMIFRLTPSELATDSPEEAVSLWRRLQDQD